MAHVCVCVSEEMLSRWLGFALSARLDANLVRWFVAGPGLGVVACTAPAPLGDIRP